MKGKVVLLLLALVGAAVYVVYGPERATAANTVGPSPLFAASLDRSIGELEGRIPKAKPRACNLRARAAPARIDDTSLAPDCTQYSGCVVTIGGPSCDYSLCEGCNYTFFNMDYTCNGNLSCGQPTLGTGLTCLQSATCSTGSTCSGASTCFQQATCVQSTACNGGATSSGTTCAGTGGTTCSTSCNPTSLGQVTCSNTDPACFNNQATTTGNTCSQIFPTCGGNTCSGSYTCTDGTTCAVGYTCESDFNCTPRLQ